MYSVEGRLPEVGRAVENGELMFRGTEFQFSRMKSSDVDGVDCYTTV